MKKIKAIMFNLPIVIICYWFLCIFLTTTVFYSNNYELLNKIDSIIVFISITHFAFHNAKYKIQQAYPFIGMLSIILLQWYSYKVDLNWNVYMALFVVLLLVIFYFIYTDYELD